MKRKNEKPKVFSDVPEQKKHFAAALAALAAGGLLTAVSAIGKLTEAPLAFLLLGAAAAAAIVYLPEEKKKQDERKLRRELTAQYGEMVTGLSLYMIAGLSLRSAWQELVKRYEAELAAGGKKRAVYEEMRTAQKEMLGGMYEDEALGRFGRRCKTAEYLRLGGLLEASVQQGNRELCRMLAAESSAGLEASLRSVKRRGEEAESWLLLPIMLLFAITLASVIVPALLGLQIEI